MSKLINELKQEHLEIKQILLELQKNGNTSSKGVKLIMNSKKKLFEHIDKEDRLLYPVLWNKAKTDLSLKKTLDIFAAEMEKVAEFVRDFYMKYSFGINNRDEFIKDIVTFRVTLKVRIMKEEAVIYSIYEKLNLD